MFCSACGAEAPGELNYCNRCGASLNVPVTAPAPPAAQMSLTKLALIIGFMLIIGMIIVFVSAGEFLRHGLDQPIVVLLALSGLAMLFGVSALLIRLWSQVNGLSAPSQPRRVQTPPQPNIYAPPPAAQLPPRPANFGSVTENTTRTFDPIYRDTIEAEGKK
ncbi:MAG: hypothetical protein QOF02_1930 [Blastocatellia bacterium]|jgi:hypothetical protein|nr:hypothetical protein [Blastocatellia bacterium]